MQGKRKSKLYEEQRTQVCGSDVPVVALRFKEVHMLWLTCDVVSWIISIKRNKYVTGKQNEEFAFVLNSIYAIDIKLIV